MSSFAYNLAPSPMHRKLGFLKWSQTFIIRNCAKVYQWAKGVLTDKQKQKLDNAEEAMKRKFYEETGVKLDAPTSQGGNTDTGNVAWRFFSPESTDVINDILVKFKVPKKEKILSILNAFGIILRVMSSKRQVHIEQYALLCRSTYILILEEFPWVLLTECLHDVLGHSAEAIEANDGFGLGWFSEQGSEATNKFIRRFSERRARQTSLEANIFDVTNRLIVRSDPQILQHARVPYCSHCNVRGMHWTNGCPAKKDKESPAQSQNEEVESYLFAE